MNRDDLQHCVPERLQAYLDRELDPSELVRVESHISQCSDCLQRFQQHQQEEIWFLQQMYSLSPKNEEIPDTKQSWQRQIQPHISTTSSSPLSSRWLEWLPQWGWGWAFLVVIPVVVVLQYTFVFYRSSQPLSQEEQVISKGNSMLTMYHAHCSVSSASLVEKTPYSTKDRQILYPGDCVQFRYNLAKKSHIMIVGLHESGEISAYVPLHSQTSWSASPGEHAFPKHALLLDDTLGWERIFLVMATQSFSFGTLKKQILQQWQQAGKDIHQPLLLPGFTYAHSILIRKIQRTKPLLDQ